MSDTAPDARYFRVSGRVQGVGFRAATRDQARQLNLAGWVRNRSDGDVELLAVGPASDLDALAAWLRDGPASAHVSDLQEKTADDHDAVPSPFVIR